MSTSPELNMLVQKIIGKSARVCVIGLGYIGLPTSAVLAENGFDVIGVDISQSVVDTISGGNIHISENGLQELVSRVVEAGKLTATVDMPQADVYIIAVPTPSHPDKSPDLLYVERAAEQLAVTLTKGSLVILESTVPPLCCENVVAPAIKRVCGLTAGVDFCLAHCPERVIPGKIIHELYHNDRIVGGVTPFCAKVAAALYVSFVKGEVLTTSATAAELCKLAENTFRDINIAYANELASICRKFGVEATEVIAMANRHPRVNILQPGIGVGGHCIAVDPWFLVHSAPEIAQLIQTARQVNDARPAQVALEIIEAAGSVGTIILLGLAYKPNVDDLRESPAVQVAALVAEKWAGQVLVVEPHVNELPKPLAGYHHMKLVDLDTAMSSGGYVKVLVAHNEFAGIAG